MTAMPKFSVSPNLRVSVPLSLCVETPAEQRPFRVFRVFRGSFPRCVESHAAQRRFRVFCVFRGSAYA